MLKKKNRLTKKEFQKIFDQKNRYFSENFSVYFLRDFGQKYAVVISKKIYKKAPTRNKLKRRIYEIIKKNLENLPQKCWTILIIKNKILEIPDETLEKEILSIFQKIKNKC